MDDFRAGTGKGQFEMEYLFVKDTELLKELLKGHKSQLKGDPTSQI